jgi:hypothetical protein
MLAGCQASGVKNQFGDQRVPEQVGLRVEAVGDFGREGILANQPENLPGFYRATNELRFRMIRFTNVGSESLELLPNLTQPSEVPAGVLTQDFWAYCPREERTCSIPMDGLLSHPIESLVSEYFSEFDLLGSEFQFDSGGVEEVALDRSTNLPKVIRFRGGESAVWVVRLGLRAGSSFILSAPLGPGYGSPGLYFMPEGSGYDPLTREIRAETLFGIRFHFGLSTAVYARTSNHPVLNPIYLSAFQRDWAIVDGKGTHPLFRSPPARVSRRIIGLAEQI